MSKYHFKYSTKSQHFRIGKTFKNGNFATLRLKKKMQTQILKVNSSIQYQVQKLLTNLKLVPLQAIIPTQKHPLF